MKYILNPGDGRDIVRTINIGEATSLKGDLYRVRDDGSGPIERFDRSMGQWYEIDEPSHSVPVKVLVAAGWIP